MKLRDVVIMPKGLTVGMGRLREDTEGVVAGIQLNDRGEEIYRIAFEGKRRGKVIERSTWISADQVERLTVL